MTGMSLSSVFRTRKSKSFSRMFFKLFKSASNDAVENAAFSFSISNGLKVAMDGRACGALDISEDVRSLSLSG